MLFLSNLFRLVFIALVLYVIFLVVRFIQSLGRPQGETHGPRSLTGTMVKDEYCNMYLPREEAIREVRDGKEHFFCSQECRDGFMKKPADTTGAPPGA